MQKEFRRPHSTRGLAKKRKLKDDPDIRRSHNEEREINLAQDYEVRHAQESGAIKVHKDPDGKSAAVEPVQGKTEVKDGKLQYVEKEKKED